MKTIDFNIKEMTREELDKVMEDHYGLVGVLDPTDGVPDHGIERFHIHGWGFIWVTERDRFKETYQLRLRARGTYTWRLYRNKLIELYQREFGVDMRVARDLYNGGTRVKYGRELKVLRTTLELQNHPGWGEYRRRNTHSWKHLWGIDNDLNAGQMHTVKRMVDYLNLRAQRREEWKEV